MIFLDTEGNMNWLKNLSITLICLTLSVLLLLGIWAVFTSLLNFMFPTNLPFDNKFVLVACLSSIGGMILFFTMEIYSVLFKTKEKIIHRRFMTNTKDSV